eukprot:1137165-Pelagomonas_calceolata.AAC.1
MHYLGAQNYTGAGTELKLSAGRGKSPYINKGKGDTLAQRSCESPPPQCCKTESANGDLEGYWKHPAPEPGCDFFVFPIARLVVTSFKLVGIHNRMGMKCMSKFDGTLVVKYQVFKLVKGMLSTTGPTNTQKDGPVSSRDLFSIQLFAPLVRTQLMGLSNAGRCVGPVWGAVPAA